MSARAPRDTGSGRPLLDKLGVRPGMRVALAGLGPEDGGFRAELALRGAHVVELQDELCGLDLVFYRVDRPEDLRGIRGLRPLIHDAGAIWVLRVKGPGRTVEETDVIETARALDLVDNKIASFSDTLAAMRLVVPLDQRRVRGGPT
ncbi:MAG TPA: hypothetical protein VKF59_09100 [Candidatus Dormibacteraeota bacterium]|nr:hypothetical protein [Candidatus Dormibacteraeota bacterium]